MSKKSIEDALRDCKTRTEINETFDSFKIVDLSERISILNNVMGCPETFFSGELTGNLRYQREVSIFLTGAWKINDIYKRAGF